MSITSSHCAGFTLPEVMLAMGIGGMLLLGSAQTFPLLRQRSQDLAQRFQLDQLMRQTLFTLTKDLRRAGYCAGTCQGKSVVLGHYPGEAKDSCVLLAFDLNNNGRWEGTDRTNSEYFGYRLRQQVIETQRGVRTCDGSGWERLLDPTEVSVSRFHITQTHSPGKSAFFVVDIAAHWRQKTAVEDDVMPMEIKQMIAGQIL